MGKLSDTVVEAVMARLFGAQTLTVPTQHRVVLSSTQPQNDGTGITEPTENGYAPAVVTNNTTTWDAPDGRGSGNAIEIAFPDVTDDDSDLGWGDLGWFAILDDDTDAYQGCGRLGGLVSPRVGDTPTFAPGELVIAAPA